MGLKHSNQHILLNENSSNELQLISFLSFSAAFLTQTVCLDDTTVKFEIWDTAGQENILLIVL